MAFATVWIGTPTASVTFIYCHPPRPLWVKTVSRCWAGSLPLYPRQQTLVRVVGMSEKCQSRKAETSATFKLA
jgi:hypothetical protein